MFRWQPAIEKIVNTNKLSFALLQSECSFIFGYYLTIRGDKKNYYLCFEGGSFYNVITHATLHLETPH
jgi:hypothetical protein